MYVCMYVINRKASNFLGFQLHSATALFCWTLQIDKVVTAVSLQLLLCHRALHAAQLYFFKIAVRINDCHSTWRLRSVEQNRESFNVSADTWVHIAGMCVRPKLLYGMRKKFLVGLNCNITPFNLTFKAYRSTVTPFCIIYKFFFFQALNFL